MWMIKPSSQDSGGCTCSLPPTIRKDVSYRYLTCRPNSAALHHPDKTASNDPSSSSEAYFVHLKLAQDTLLDPVKRFAYDRFGPDIIKWRHCSSIRDYVMVGLQTTAPYYAASGLFMVILGVVGYLEWGRYVHPPIIFCAPIQPLLIYRTTVALPILHRSPHVRAPYTHSPHLRRPFRH